MGLGEKTLEQFMKESLLALIRPRSFKKEQEAFCTTSVKSDAIT